MKGRFLGKNGPQRLRFPYRLSYGVISLAIISLLGTSCTKDNNSGRCDEHLRIQLNPVKNSIAKASAGGFADYAELGLTVVPYADNQVQGLSGFRYEDNVQFTYDPQVQKFISLANAYFPDNTTLCDLYAYHPFTGSGFKIGASTLDINLCTDQSNGSDYDKADYMVASAKGVAPSGEPVPLLFNHILSKVDLVLKAGEGCTLDELKEADIRLVSLYSKGIYEVENTSFHNLSMRDNITPFGSFRVNNDKLEGLSAILIPQTKAGGESLLYVVFEGRTHAYKPETELVFESGKEYQLTITVSVESIGVKIEVNSEIGNWTENEKITGSVDAETPFKGSVTDVDGNTYDYVQIGDLYWTAQNLKTTKYSDNTDIPHVPGGNKEWVALTTPAYCCLENNPENIQKSGFLYNFFAVETGKLCPDGWRLPTKAELKQLIDEDGGSVDVNTLLDISWGNEATNTTGFSAVHGGMSGSHWYMNTDGYFWSSTVKEADDVVQGSYLYISKYPWTGINAKSTGMSVRCVKNIN